MASKIQSILVLNDIRSTHNVGAIFRTADAAGIEKIYLVGITPGPLDRFGRVRNDVAKAALGAEQTIAWESVKTLAPLITRLKKMGYAIIAVEQSSRAIDYKKVPQTPKMAFIVGNEVGGLSAADLAKCDLVAEIPMRGMKESLNVSVATGIALFRILRI